MRISPGQVVKKQKVSPHRSVVVFSTLVGILSLTSVILLLLAPAPLKPGAAESLFAVDTPDEMAAIFQTHKPLAAWNYIYIHQSGTEPAVELTGDHFIIGNGTEQGDGELQISQRWIDQAAGSPPPGAQSLASNCISICVMGNFDQAPPTPTQLRRLGQLIAGLQGRLQLPSAHVVFVEHASKAAGIGQYFPVTAFQQEMGALNEHAQ